MCKKEFYGQNCQEKIGTVNIINKGISNSEFTFLLLLIIFILPSLLLIGLISIFFICKNNPNNYSNKNETNKGNNILNSKRTIKNSKDFKLNDKLEMNNQINFNDLERKINDEKIYGDSNNYPENKDYKYLKTDNTNLLYSKNTDNLNNITNNLINNEDKFKYSNIQLNSDSNNINDNMLITIRNNTESDNNISEMKRPGIQLLNKTKGYNYYYKGNFNEIENFISEYKNSLYENFSENENFMIFIENNFTSIENLLNEKDYGNNHITTNNRNIIEKIKIHTQKIFTNLQEYVPNGKNYIRANNFLNRFEQIFNINDETNIIEEENSINDIGNQSRLKYNYNNNYDLSFNNEKGEIYNKNNREINTLISRLNKNENIEPEFPNIISDSNNENFNINNSNNIVTNKNRVDKKAFAIKSVEITKSNFKVNKNEEKNIELSNAALKSTDQHKRNESRKSIKFPDYENVSKND